MIEADEWTGCSGCEECGGCNSHFMQLQPSLGKYKVSKHFIRDVKNPEKIIKNVLSCAHSCFTELHKFEKKVNNMSVFRAKMDGIHIVYAIGEFEKGKRIVFFLRALKNFQEYTKFLENDKDIEKMINSSSQ